MLRDRRRALFQVVQQGQFQFLVGQGAARALATWISPGDLLRLVLAALSAPAVGHRIVYGISASARPIWDPAPGSAIGYQARDSSEPWRAAIEAADPEPDPMSPLLRWHGGDYMRLGPFD